MLMSTTTVKLFNDNFVVNTQPCCQCQNLETRTYTVQTIFNRYEVYRYLLTLNIV